MPDDFTIKDDFESEQPAPAPPVAESDDFSTDDFASESQTTRVDGPEMGPLEKARILIRENRDRQQAVQLVRQHFEQEMAAKAEKERNDPRNWSSTRFKKEMAKPQTPQDQAFYDATLADIKSREKGLFKTIMTEVFDRPAAANREAIRSGLRGENPGKGWLEGATNPEKSQTFQAEWIKKLNDSISADAPFEEIFNASTQVLGPIGQQAASYLTSKEDKEAFVRFSAGLAPSTAGLIADTVTSPADMLLTILGERALRYIAKIPAGARTVGERLSGPLKEVFSKGPLPPKATPAAPIPAASASQIELPAAERQGIRIEGPSQLPPAGPAAAAAAQPPPSGAPSALGEAAEGLYQKTFNRLQSLENLSAEAKAKGFPLKPGEDPGLRSRGYLGIEPKVQSVLEDKTFRITPEGKIETTGEGLKPILKDHDRFLPKIGKAEKEKDLVEYLKSRRIIEDLQRPRPDDPTAMIATPQQVAAAEQVMSGLKAKYGEAMTVLDDTAKRLYDYQKRVLQSLVDSGNMSEEGYKAILKNNPNYVPFERVIDDIEFEGVVPRNQNRFSGANSPVKKIVGSEREIHDPIESMIKNTYRILDVAERNTVARSVAKLADVMPGKIQIINHADPKAIRFYENGTPQYMRASENITDAMKGLNENSASLLVKILSMPANWLRTGATLTPEFMARNPLRDQFTALLQTKVGYKPLVDSTGAIADIMGRKEIYYDWMRSGGAHSTITELSRENLGRMLSKIRGNPKLLSKLNIITHAQDLSQLMEQATRLGVYKAAQLGKGMSSLEAGFQSREATVDFARIGSSMKDPNRVIAFFNAGLQGIDKSLRTAAKDPAGLAAKGTALITLPSVLLHMINRDDPDYHEIPMWQKNLFWMFKAPNTDTWVRIPKPFLYGQVFGSVPERFLEYADTKDPRALDSLKEALMGSLTPVSGEPESILLPTAIKPIIENFANRSMFTGRPIVPESKTRLRPEEQSARYTSRAAKAVGGALHVSPAKFENLVSGYGGGLGRYALQLGDRLLEQVDKFTGKEPLPKRPREVTDIPLVKGFTSRSAATSPESVNEFYEHKKAAEEDYMTARQRFNEGDKAGAEKILKEGNAEFYKLTRKAADSLSKLAAHADGLVKSGKYSEAELRQKLREIDQQELDIARQVNKVINAKKRK